MYNHVLEISLLIYQTNFTNFDPLDTILNFQIYSSFYNIIRNRVSPRLFLRLSLTPKRYKREGNIS